MVKNIKSLKQIDENGMNEYIAKFAFQENNSSQDTMTALKTKRCTIRHKQQQENVKNCRR